MSMDTDNKGILRMEGQGHQFTRNTSIDTTSMGHKSPTLNMQHSSSFYMSTNIAFLFKGWETRDDVSYFLSLLAIIALAIFSVYLKSVKMNLEQVPKQHTVGSFEGEQVTGAPEKNDDNQMKIPVASYSFLEPLFHCTECFSNRKAYILLLSVVTFLDIVLSYCLMLLAMTFEVGVLFAVSLGLTAGYVFFFLQLHLRKAAVAGRYVPKSKARLVKEEERTKLMPDGKKPLGELTVSQIAHRGEVV